MFSSKILGHSVKDVIARVHVGIQNRIPIAQLTTIVSNEPDFRYAQPEDLFEYMVTCARLRKLVKRVNHIKAIKDRANEAVEFIDCSKLNSSKLPQFLWACATIEVRPLLIENFTDGIIEQGLSCKDMVKTIWALSKLISDDNDPLRNDFQKLTEKITHLNSFEFSNEDLVALARAIAVIYSR